MNENTAALVLETNNGELAGAERVLAALAWQTRPSSTLDQIVVTHDGLDDAAAERLRRAAGDRVRVDLVRTPAGADYYEAKNAGFAATRADIVAFADSDCDPEPAWLEELLAPFADPAVRVVAGRTTYRRDLLGIAASTLDFMYFASPLGDDATRNFYANNVAFRRGVFAPTGFPTGLPMYRGSCQVLGMSLHQDRVAVRFAPRARTIHRFPDRRRELVRLRFLRGADTTAIARSLVDTHLPARLRFVGHLGKASALAVLAGRFTFSVRALNRQDMPETRGARRAAAVGLIALLSALDVAGAVAARRRSGHRRRTTTLSYQRE